MRPARWRRSAFAGIVQDGGEGVVQRLADFEGAEAERGGAIRARGASSEDLVDPTEGAGRRSCPYSARFDAIRKNTSLGTVAER